MKFHVTFVMAIGATLALASFGQAPLVNTIPYETSTAIARRPPRSAADPIRLTPPQRVVLEALDVEPLIAEDERMPPGSPLRVARARDITPVTAANGMWSPLAEGGWVWTADFEVPAAKGLRLRVRGFDSTHTGEMRILDLDDPSQFVGPLRGSRLDESWTQTLQAERIRVEYEVEGDEPPDVREPRFVIDSVSIWYRAGRDSSTPNGSPGDVLLPCHLDVNCYSQWLFEGSAVGRVFYIDAAGDGWVCSGALLNRIPGDYSALFMTANHCTITNTNASSVEIWWFYRSVGCGSTSSSTGSITTGSPTLLVSDPNTDLRLLGLIEAPPNGVAFLGWDANYWANGSQATSIHHPAGTFQRISFGTKQENVDMCEGGNGWRVRYLVGDGPLQGGSSGSPVLDASGRVRGVLSCSNDYDCQQHDNGEHGRLDFAYARLKPYLTPVDPIYAKRNYSGSEQGTSSQPFNTLIEASFAVISGSTIWMSPGTYSETPTLTKPMVLRTTGGDVVIGS